MSTNTGIHPDSTQGPQQQPRSSSQRQGISQDGVTEDEEEMPRKSTRRRVDTGKKRGPGILRGLMPENIISVDGYLPSDDAVPTSTLSKNRHYATRELVNGPSTALYDQKYHPMDDELHKGRARAHRRRSAFAQSDKTYDQIILSDKSGNRDDNDDDEEGSQTLSLGSDAEESSASHVKRFEKTRYQKAGTRRSSRCRDRGGPRPLYDTKRHPIDIDLAKIYEADGKNPHFEEDRERAAKRRRTSSIKADTAKPAARPTRKHRLSVLPNSTQTQSVQPAEVRPRGDEAVDISGDTASSDGDDDHESSYSDPESLGGLDEAIDLEAKTLQKEQTNPENIRDKQHHGGTRLAKSQPEQQLQERDVDDDYLDSLDSPTEMLPKLRKYASQSTSMRSNRTPSDGSKRTISGGSSVTICEDPKGSDCMAKTTGRPVLTQRDRDLLDDPKENHNPADGVTTVNPRMLMMNRISEPGSP